MSTGDVECAEPVVPGRCFCTVDEGWPSRVEPRFGSKGAHVLGRGDADHRSRGAGPAVLRHVMAGGSDDHARTPGAPILGLWLLAAAVVSVVRSQRCCCSLRRRSRVIAPRARHRDVASGLLTLLVTPGRGPCRGLSRRTCARGVCTLDVRHPVRRERDLLAVLRSQPIRGASDSGADARKATTCPERNKKARDSLRKSKVDTGHRYRPGGGAGHS